MSAPDLKVVTLHERTIQDIPAMLRHMANQIEAAELGDLACLVAVTIDTGENAAVFGFGDVPSKFHAIGVLQSGIADLCGNGGA